MIRFLSAEPLEARIAPATFTYIDIDGDDVVIKTSKGTDADLAAMGVLVFSDMNPETPRQLLEIDFSQNAAVFEGTSLSVMAKRSPTNGGDGHANVGYIDAQNFNGGAGNILEGLKLNLGKVVIDGDLGQIDCGTATIAAIQSLDVLSMGRFGLTTQSPTNDSVACLIDGRIGALRVRTDFVSVNIDTAQIGSITIGGSIFGTLTGYINANGSIGAIKIGGNINGGFDEFAGSIRSSGSIKSIFVGGDIIGGDDTVGGNDDSVLGAIIAAGNIGPVTIRGDLRGPEEMNAGARFSGVISAGGNLGAVKIGGNLAGTSLDGNGFDNSTDFSGTVRAGGSIKSVVLGGSLLAGGDFSVIGDFLLSGAIAAGKNIGSVTVLGSLLGEPSNLSYARIIAGVADAPVNGKLPGIGKIMVKGSVEFGDIRAGVVAPGFVGAPNFDAQIGSVTVGLNWIGSNLLAGIGMIGSDNLAMTSRIGPITIGGQVLGDFGGTSFTFSAEEVVSLKIGGQVIPLKKGFRNDLVAIPLGATGDVSVVEVT